ncbi:MAG: hypothetical protein JSU06_17345 [Actinobacteria bacterium]|nr:hypothetical protein [Actinomycetota bacterium]
MTARATRGCLTAIGVAFALVAFFLSFPLGRPASAATTCPSVSALERPVNPRGAIPTAKAALGSPGRVLEVTRGPGSTYAGPVRRSCGAAVLRDSIYVVVHPLGQTCSACNLHAYVIKFRHGAWKVWTAY